MPEKQEASQQRSRLRTESRRERRQRLSKESTTPFAVRRLLPLILALFTLVAVLDWLFRSGDSAARGGPGALIPLSVRVADSDGAAIAGLFVDFYEESDLEHRVFQARSDADGRATLPADLSDGRFFVLVRDASGTVSMGTHQARDAAERLIEFSEAAPLAGQVVDTQGKGLAGAKVEARFALPKSPVLETRRSDAQGRVRFTHLPRVLPFFLLRARKSGYAVHEIEWRRGEDPLRIELGRTRAIRVQVRTPDGRPAVGIPYRVFGVEEEQGKTDSGGWITTSGQKPKQSIFLRLKHKTLTHRLREDLIPRKEPYVLRLEKPATLIGKIVNPAGQPLAGIELRHNHGPRAWVRTRSNGQGYFTLGDLPEGPCRIFYELDGGVVESSTVDIDGGITNRGFVIRAKRDG